MKSIWYVIAALLTIHAVGAADSKKPKFKPTTIRAPFIEQFGADWDSRWKASGAMKEIPKDFKAGENENPEDMFRYRGEWSVESPPGNGNIDGDKVLVMKTAGAHHAISVAFPKIVDPADKDLVVQYELKFKEELRCTGAYIKLLTESKDGIKYHEFDDKTPYTIMFGPDTCGTTSKVHFIFRHRNPITGKFEEKHYRHHPSFKNDLKTNLYTLLVHPNNTFHIYINNERTKTGNLLEDFDPPVNPPRTLDDPEDVKPEDWVEEIQIPDPEATKPADWDDNAPRMILDESAVKPADWLEDEPEFIPDPSAEKPSDWDDEEDGQWIAPQISNPTCEKVTGCGKWTPPMRPNPAYRGTWNAPLIANPKYQGPWKARQLPNPHFFEDLYPSKFTKIMGIGIENWVMQAGVSFDNFYIGHSISDAKRFADETWAIKKESEDAAEEAERKATEERMAKERKIREQEDEDEEEEDEPSSRRKKPKSSFSADSITSELFKFFKQFQADPVAAVKQFPYVAVTMALIFLTPIYLFMNFGKKIGEDIDDLKKSSNVSSKKSKKDEAESAEGEADDENEGKARRRRTQSQKDSE